MHKPHFLSLPGKLPFDFNYLKGILRELKDPKTKIMRMEKAGQIVRLKKGLFALGPEFGGKADKNVLANAIYGPSCVSLETALSFHALIPEKVAEITSVTPKRNKNYNTAIGRFSYQHVPMHTFPVGVEYHYEPEGAFLLATKEKALSDKVMLTPKLRSLADIKAYLFQDLRIEEQGLLSLDVELLAFIESHYRIQKVALLCRWLLALQKGKFVKTLKENNTV